MLTIIVPIGDAYDESLGKFVAEQYVELELEHSLVALSKWESNFKKPFLGPDEKTDEESMWYVKAMTLTPGVADEVYRQFTSDNLRAIQEYISDPMTATTFMDQRHAQARELITAEIIYYWMVALSIPFECENWHLNRLITLVRVCNLKNAPPEQMSPGEAAAQQRALNAQRKAQLGTRG